MLFSDLPPDILSEVTSWIFGLDVIALWFCGDHALNWKLSKAGGVKTFNWPKKASFWPHLLRELSQLESLSLVYDRGDSFFGGIIPNLLTLASTMQNLVLNFPMSHAYFLSALRLNPHLFSGLKTLECVSFAPTSGLDAFQGVKWPKLTFLTLRLGYTPAICRQTTLRLSALPLTLVHLNLHLNRFEVDIQAFPPNLTYFELHCVHTDPFAALLPQTLSSLNYHGYYGAESEAYELDWSQLPENLIFLKITCPDATPAQFESLPRGIRELKVSYLNPRTNTHSSAQILQALPSKLKSCPRLTGPVDFDLASSFPRHWTGKVSDVELAAVHALPLGITKITVPHLIMPHMPDIQAFPPALTYLYITSINDHVFSILPPGLTELIVQEGRISEKNLKSLPKGLVILKLERLVEFVTYEAWQSIPRNLSDLNVHFVSKKIIDAPRVSAESSLWLPRRLVSLKLDTMEISDVSWFEQLPTTLEMISLKITKIPFNAFLHLQQCPSLRSILLTTEIASEEEVGTPHNQRIDLGNLLRTLPASVGDFCFFCEEDAKWYYSNDDLKHLPKGLSFIVLPQSSTGITSDILPYLPAKLAYFDHQWFQDHLKAKLKLNRARERKITLSIAPTLGMPLNVLEAYFNSQESKSKH